MSIRTLWRKYRRPVLFMLVGGINTGVDLAVFALVHAMTGLPEEGCQAISYTAGILCSFLLNQQVTFRDGDGGKMAARVLRFAAVNAVSLLVGVVGIRLLVSAGLHAYLAKLVITALVAGINYFGYKLLVFRVKRG